MSPRFCARWGRRLSGRESLAGLRALCSERAWCLRLGAPKTWKHGAPRMRAVHPRWLSGPRKDGVLEVEVLVGAQPIPGASVHETCPRATPRSAPSRCGCASPAPPLCGRDAHLSLLLVYVDADEVRCVPPLVLRCGAAALPHGVCPATHPIYALRIWSKFGPPRTDLVPKCKPRPLSQRESA
jgi:hypothetical protein